MSGIKKGRLNSEDWIILSGFGGGLTYGAACFSGKNVYQGFEK